MKIGKFNCSLKRNGVIEIKKHNEFKASDKIAVNKFYQTVARRNKHKLPVRMEFV